MSMNTSTMRSSTSIGTHMMPTTSTRTALTIRLLNPIATGTGTCQCDTSIRITRISITDMGTPMSIEQNDTTFTASRN